VWWWGLAGKSVNISQILIKVRGAPPSSSGIFNSGFLIISAFWSWKSGFLRIFTILKEQSCGT
jgi:hypothetical protein